MKLCEKFTWVPTAHKDRQVEELPQKFLEFIEGVNKVRDSIIRRKMTEAKQSGEAS